MAILTSTTKPIDRIDSGFLSDESNPRERPIELQTENDFSIIRRCDVDEITPIPSGGR